MRSVLVAWIGSADLKAPKESAQTGVGPIAQALDGDAYDEALLLSDWAADKAGPYAKWLRPRTSAKVEIVHEKLSGPTQFGEIYQAAVRGVQRALGEQARDTSLSFHLSPGTPAMASIWVLLAKTRFPAQLIESSREHGVQKVHIPFDIAADFIPDLLRERDERLRATSGAAPADAPEFADIIHQSRVMGRLIGRARLVAPRNVPVLIEGESGTGKEMLARAIHRASPRNRKELIAVNCGAIPANLIESELFGHEKGAFTDAKQQKQGFFEAATGSTLFLDEIGELPGPAQVKLLRVLQEREVVRLGSQKPVKVDVRIVAATNRTLTEEITAGRFREDLFYRLAVAVLKIAPLRERTDDLGPLFEHLMGQVNRDAVAEGSAEKKLSAGAKNLLRAHSWPGNVRELLNTLRRAAIWSEGATISREDARDALLPLSGPSRQDVIGRPLGDGFNLAKLLKEVAGHYLGRAMDEAKGSKTKAAELVGLPSYQTLTNWLTKYDVGD